MNNTLRESHEALLKYALSLPGAWEDAPWGERVAKVGKKVFVFFGRSTPDEPRLMLAVKLPQSGLQALDQSFTEPTGYGLGKSGWVSASFSPGDRPNMQQLRAWVLESYRAIAPKKVLKEIDSASSKPAAITKPAPRKKPTASKKRAAAKPAPKVSAAKKTRR